MKRSPIPSGVWRRGGAVPSDARPDPLFRNLAPRRLARRKLVPERKRGMGLHRFLLRDRFQGFWRSQGTFKARP